MTFPLMPHALRQKLTEARVVASAVAGSSTSAAAPVTVPAGVLAGDLLLFISYVYGTEAVSVPAGFTKLTDAPSSGWGSKIVTSARIATAGLSGTTVVGTSGPSGTGNILLVIRGDAPISGFAAVGSGFQQSNNNPSTATASVSLAATPTLAIGVAGAIQASPYPPPTFEAGFTTPVFAQEYASTHFVRAGVNQYPQGTTPVKQDVDMADFGGGNFLTAFFLNLTGG